MSWMQYPSNLFCAPWHLRFLSRFTCLEGHGRDKGPSGSRGRAKKAVSVGTKDESYGEQRCVTALAGRIWVLVLYDIDLILNILSLVHIFWYSPFMYLGIFNILSLCIQVFSIFSRASIHVFSKFSLPVTRYSQYFQYYFTHECFYSQYSPFMDPCILNIIQRMHLGFRYTSGLWIFF